MSWIRRRSGPAGEMNPSEPPRHTRVPYPAIRFDASYEIHYLLITIHDRRMELFRKLDSHEGWSFCGGIDCNWLTFYVSFSTVHDWSKRGFVVTFSVEYSQIDILTIAPTFQVYAKRSFEYPPSRYSGQYEELDVTTILGPFGATCSRGSGRTEYISRKVARLAMFSLFLEEFSPKPSSRNTFK